MAITIGIAAGLINAGVVFLQLTFPLLIVFLLVALLPLENNAVTWSVVGRQLQGSFWPLILQADSTSSTKVNSRVLWFSLASTLGLLLLALAAVVTPLGLYQSVSEGVGQTSAFVYAKDYSPIGLATYKRDEYRTSRLCDAGLYLTNCPGQEHGFTYFTNATGSFMDGDDESAYISSVPPANLSRIFGSGREGNLSTVASALDMQYRSYLQISNIEQNSSLGLIRTPKFRIDQYRKRSVGRFVMFQSHLLDDEWVIVDGIVANMKTGGLALRNHTIPAYVGQGAEWTESLLWLEPETACVDTNLTYKWSIPIDPNAFYMKPSIVDNGGIVNLSVDYPYLDLNDTQTNPQLSNRAYKGALLWNFNMMKYFNTSRTASSLGKSYALPQRSIWWTGQLVLDRFTDIPTNLRVAGDYLSFPPGLNLTRMFVAPRTSVWGVAGGDLANISHITVDGGILLGAPVGDNGEIDYHPDAGTGWRAPLYSCISTIKASIMDVTFTINKTAALENLRVKYAQPRKYSSNATTPLWAIEDTGFNVSNISPLWGMVGNEYETAPNLWTLRKEYLYLPAGRSQMTATTGDLAKYESDAWAAGTPQAALANMYTCAINALTCQSIPDLSGKFSYALFLRWRQYTKSAAAAPRIFNLIWTDVMLNFVTSGRSKLTATGTDSTNIGVSADAKQVTAPLVISSTFVSYHIWFAVPGIVFLAFYVMVVVAFILLLIFKRATFNTLRSLSNQTAVGRAMTIERFAGRPEIKAMPTKAWVEIHGDSDLLISKHAELSYRENNKTSEDQSTHEVEVLSLLVPKSDNLHQDTSGDDAGKV